jgi:hypothetical protein
VTTIFRKGVGSDFVSAITHTPASGRSLAALTTMPPMAALSS